MLHAIAKSSIVSMDKSASKVAIREEPSSEPLQRKHSVLENRMVKILSPLKRPSIAPSASRHTSAEAVSTIAKKEE